jgi:hypothetical protein
VSEQVVMTTSEMMVEALGDLSEVHRSHGLWWCNILVIIWYRVVHPFKCHFPYHLLGCLALAPQNQVDKCSLH